MEQALKEELESINVDVAGTIRRFSGNDKLFVKNLLKFPNDDSFAKLELAVKENNPEVAVREAHSLKGLSGNLGLTPLFEASTLMVNALRADINADMSVLFENEKKAYEKIVTVINKYIPAQ